MIPDENFSDEGDILFPETTKEFFDLLKEESSDDIMTDIAISHQKFLRMTAYGKISNFDE